MAKPRISDATGWTSAWGFDDFTHVRVFEPKDLVPGLEPRDEKRFSYVPKDVVLRNWFKVVVPGKPDKYFYGEMASSDARRYALDCELAIVYS